MIEKTFIEINDELKEMIEDYEAEKRTWIKLVNEPGADEKRKSMEYIMGLTAARIAEYVSVRLKNIPF